MKKKLIFSTLLIVLAALLVSNAAGCWFLYEQERRDSTQSLRELLILMDSQSQITNADSAAEQFHQAAPDKRLTIITPDGTVLVDTKADADQLEDHANRPEVITALSTGWGADVRSSDTVGVPLLYVAKKFTDGMIGRASMPLSSIESLVWKSVTGFLIASVVALLLSLLLARRMAQKVLEPLNAVGGALTGVLSGASTTTLDAFRGDDELRPILRYIDKLVERLSGSIHNLTVERDKVNLILDCMDEGFLLLDEDGGLLASNRAARNLFGVPEDSSDAAGLLVLTRSRRLREATEQCHRQKSPVMLDVDDLPLPGRSLRFFLSPVSGRQYEGENVGTSILISDVTELKAAERIRADFTANVSHELKTPLTSIKGFTDMLSSGMVTSAEDQKRFSSLIGVEVDRLIALINDILKLSELESLTMEQGEESAPVLATAQEVRELLDLKAKESDITFTVEGEECSAAISAPRLKEVILNLAENGLKYNRPGGHLTITVTPGTNQVTLQVADSGLGIPAEDQARVFERFYRVDKGRCRKDGGTGLGLAIVKHIVALYHGSIELKSQVDVGSTFSITLPKAV
ncbi:PAS domain-containing protein [Pseudoflavonifractor sp. DSM 107456]|uniref:histidine kinase n=1 Tax=Pseudoflavonifractor gallinarum TaxID=2779352 RepID=A0ABR9R9C8_9FIRM|nr:ATP-binding protein [Pseudoflavonifractor gallinarum]MBE5054923.1 PAS domain-containing protein [Pseudoflavonifractor gallinarum]